MSERAAPEFIKEVMDLVVALSEAVTASPERQAVQAPVVAGLRDPEEEALCL